MYLHIKSTHIWFWHYNWKVGLPFEQKGLIHYILYTIVYCFSSLFALWLGTSDSLVFTTMSLDYAGSRIFTHILAYSLHSAVENCQMCILLIRKPSNNILDVQKLNHKYCDI